MDPKSIDRAPDSWNFPEAGSFAGAGARFGEPGWEAAAAYGAFPGAAWSPVYRLVLSYTYKIICVHHIYLYVHQYTYNVIRGITS